MVLVDGAVINESLMLLHAGTKRNIVIFAPSSEGVEEEDRVLVSLLDKVFSGLLKEEAMSIMEGVSNLEGEKGISTQGFGLSRDLSRSKSVLVHIVVPQNLLNEVHRFSRDQPVSLSHDVFSIRVRFLEASEGTGADFFLSVCEEDGLVNNSKVLSLVGKGDVLGIFEAFFLFGSAVLSDRNRHKVNLSINSKSLLVHALEQFHLVHESFERVGPPFSDSLQELDLHFVDLEAGVSGSSTCSLGVNVNESRYNRARLSVVLNASVLEHISLEDSHAFVKVHLSSVNVKSINRGIIRSTNSSEVLHGSTASFFVESLGISRFTSLEISTDIDFNERLIVVFVSLSSLSSGSCLR